jgi:hypothetical protein
MRSVPQTIAESHSAFKSAEIRSASAKNAHTAQTDSALIAEDLPHGVD